MIMGVRSKNKQDFLLNFKMVPKQLSYAQIWLIVSVLEFKQK